jgi:NAD(P)H-quinone oxidoreductase subunit 5
MNTLAFVNLVQVVAPALVMGAALALTQVGQLSTAAVWRTFQGCSLGALLLSCGGLLSGGAAWAGVVVGSPLSAAVAVLVQLLGAVIGGFSARYLQGEPGQRRYVAALAAVLAAVHLLLVADHWVLLIAAWAAVGWALQLLLCHYPDRPFALLAAHKKRLADRLADLLLVVAAGLAWRAVGSGSLSALWAHLAAHGLSGPLKLSALALVGAVILRTALLPVHGWLIQVMEAPTPVSALLHAGVVNLGGFVLIRFEPLLEQATAARGVLLLFGLATSVLAGMVLLTRISIKVRLAWSTVAQMGFMLLECAVGLYTLALLHLIGHSLYKAHAFLSASMVVRSTRIQALHPASVTAAPTPVRLLVAPVLSTAVVFATVSGVVVGMASPSPWPWWWSVVLGLAWAPLLWVPARSVDRTNDLLTRAGQLGWGLLLAGALTAAALGVHALPLGIKDAPHHGLGVIALVGLAGLYLCLALLQWRPHRLEAFRRWSYAGFYVDEAYTRLALTVWQTRWVPATPTTARLSKPHLAAAVVAEAVLLDPQL